VTEEGSTSISGSYYLPSDELPPVDRGRVSPIRFARTLVRLACARGRLAHLPTLGQIRAMAWFDGQEPCSYLLDREVNFVPEPMEFGYASELGQHALCFTCQDGYGRVMGAGHHARRRRV
jgi:hypothetical protein